MPNTKPVNDNASVTELVLARAAAAGLARVLPVGCISRGPGRARSSPSTASSRRPAASAFTDDGKPVVSSALMRRALEYAHAFGLPVAVHEEDPLLAGKGVMHEGPDRDAARPEGHPGRRRGRDGRSATSRSSS